MDTRAYKVFFHFGHESLTTIYADDVQEIFDTIKQQKNGWLELQGELINLDNVTYISYKKRSISRSV